MEENEVIDVDAIFNEMAQAEQSEADPAPTAPTPAPTEERGAPEPTVPRVPPSDGTKDSETAKPEQSEESELAQIKARLAKTENDLVLAKKAQAALDRKNAALAEAKNLEWQTLQQAIAAGTLTTEQVAAGPQRMDAWVQRRDAEAAQAEAEAARLREQAETETARAAREAEIEFKEQAFSLLPDRVELGLAATDVDVEKLLLKHLETPDRQADIALTWKITDPAEQARISTRVMRGALADAKAEMAALAEAKKTTEEKKAARSQYDRSTAAGPATGGRDPLPTFTSVEDDLENYAWKQ